MSDSLRVADRSFKTVNNLLVKCHSAGSIPRFTVTPTDPAFFFGFGPTLCKNTKYGKDSIVMLFFYDGFWLKGLIAFEMPVHFCTGSFIDSEHVLLENTQPWKINRLLVKAFFLYFQPILIKETA